MKTVDVSEFERDFESLLENVENTGESIRVSRNGVPFAELRPVEEHTLPAPDPFANAPTSVD
jgi:prevent-host-death family protein